MKKEKKERKKRKKKTEYESIKSEEEEKQIPNTIAILVRELIDLYSQSLIIENCHTVRRRGTRKATSGVSG